MDAIVCFVGANLLLLSCTVIMLTVVSCDLLWLLLMALHYCRYLSVAVVVTGSGEIICTILAILIVHLVVCILISKRLESCLCFY
jgi:hypothetical protein